MSSFSIAVVLLMMVLFANAADICPGYGFVRRPPNCQSTCSANNDKCSTGKKCCYRLEKPCGFHCIVPKVDVEKAGKCPTSPSLHGNPNWRLCDAHLCDVDNDCKDSKKCCANKCGAKICIAPQ